MIILVHNTKTDVYNFLSVNLAREDGPDNIEDAIEDLFAEDTDGVYSVFTVESETDLAQSSLTGKAYLEFLFEATGETIKKFKNKRAAAARIFPYVEQLATPAENFSVVGKVKDLPADGEKKRKHRKSKGIHIEPQESVAAVRPGSKQEAIIEALKTGATLEDLQSVTGWTPQAVKSALYWDVGHVKGYGVRTEYRADDEETPVYFLVLPEPSGSDRVSQT